MKHINVIARTLIVFSWLVFVASFFVPANDGLGRIGASAGSPVNGWTAMVDNFWLVFVRPIVVLIEPRFAAFLVIPIANAFVFVSPILSFSAPDDSFPIAIPLIAFTSSIWMMPADFHDHVLIGFYLWNLSPLCMAIGIILLSRSNK